MRQACVIETHGLAYRQKFLQSYRKAIWGAVRNATWETSRIGVYLKRLFAKFEASV
jgi:hypothetical protein